MIVLVLTVAVYCPSLEDERTKVPIACESNRSTNWSTPQSKRAVSRSPLLNPELALSHVLLFPRLTSLCSGSLDWRFAFNSCMLEGEPSFSPKIRDTCKQLEKPFPLFQEIIGFCHLVFPTTFPLGGALFNITRQKPRTYPSMKMQESNVDKKAP